MMFVQYVWKTSKKSQSLDYCKYQCGKSVYQNCLDIWAKKTDCLKCLFCCCDW
uniref:Uncharacterized protein n=1 Tax=viral metagenome TaxID=1070528 RepID=A0A6C0CAN4_9ZZZZ